ncbi:hypothetical protein RB595_004452 [Gaeumannomyces hyphopodioides]
METVATWFGYGKPSPQEQARNVKRIIRNNIRKLEASEKAMKDAEKKMLLLIKKAHRDLNNPTVANPAQVDVRDYALMVVRNRKQADYLATCKAGLRSIDNNAVLALTMHQMQNAISVGINTMRTKDQSISLAQATSISQRLVSEQLQAEVIEEIMLESLPQEGAATAAEEGAVEKVMNEVIKDSLATSKVPTTAPALDTPATTAPQDEEEEVQEENQEETTQALIGDLDNRLEALRSG